MNKYKKKISGWIDELINNGDIDPAVRVLGSDSTDVFGKILLNMGFELIEFNFYKDIWKKYFKYQNKFAIYWEEYKGEYFYLDTRGAHPKKIEIKTVNDVKAIYLEFTGDVFEIK